MIDLDNGLVCCDHCACVLDLKAYRVDMEGCYCLACAQEELEEKLENTSRDTCVSIDRVDAEDFWYDI